MSDYEIKWRARSKGGWKQRRDARRRRGQQVNGNFKRLMGGKGAFMDGFGARAKIMDSTAEAEQQVPIRWALGGRVGLCRKGREERAKRTRVREWKREEDRTGTCARPCKCTCTLAG
jgi:hypothetical protein